jgi:glycopeptide antibiotics resistance protein
MMVVVVVLFPLRVDAGLRADDAVWDYTLFLRYSVNLVPFASIRNMVEHARPSDAARQIAGNLALLLPLGMLAPALFLRMRRVVPMVALGVGAAVGIEVIQYLARIARLSLRSIDVDDAILNMLGAAVGYLLWLVWSRRAASRRRSASRAMAPT